MKPGANLLFAEPRRHVKVRSFEDDLMAAVKTGLRVVDRPAIRSSLAAVLQKLQRSPL
jgi:hypothetical protein